MVGLRSPGLAPASREALLRVLAAPTFELIPLKHAMDQAALLPAGARVSVTASPSRGIEATVELACSLQGAGFAAVPHLAAHMVRDRAHLAELLARLRSGGVGRAFVVGGDAIEPGAFPDGLSLLRAMAEAGRPFAEVGIPGYPEGHPFIAADILRQALVDKQPFASSLTTQLCFDPKSIGAWLAGCRAEGIRLPVRVGVPGVAEMRKLIEITARIGIGDSRRFLVKNLGLVGRLVRPGGYHPDGLLAGLAPLVADPALGIVDVHLYTFNQVATTEAWRRQFLERLEDEAARVPA